VQLIKDDPATQNDEYPKSIYLDLATESGVVTVGGGSADQPELIVAEMLPEWVTQDETYKVNYVVKNKGGVASTDFTMALYIDGESEPVVTQMVNELAAGETFTGSFDDYEIELSDGEDELKLCVDYEEQVTEGDETNNCSEEIWPTLDLVVSNISVTWIEQEKTYEVTYTIYNTGGIQAEASTTAVTINGKDTFESIPAIEANDKYEAKYGPVTLSESGLDTIEICADFENVVEESNEDNNCTQKKWPEETSEPPSEADKPDLSIKEHGKEWKEKGKTYVVNYIVENGGSADAETFSVTLYLNGDSDPVSTESVTGLKAGEIYEGKFDQEELELSEGEDDLKICVDSDNQVSESDENNNCVEFTINSSDESPGTSYPQVPETRPPTPGITISWEYIGGIIGLIFLVGLLGFAVGRR
jgi:subtilase family serine protease